MRTEARNAFRGQGLVANEELAVLLGEDVVGHHGHVELVSKVAAEREDKRRLATGTHHHVLVNLQECTGPIFQAMSQHIGAPLQGYIANLPTGPPMPTVTARSSQQRAEIGGSLESNLPASKQRGQYASASPMRMDFAR